MGSGQDKDRKPPDGSKTPPTPIPNVQPKSRNIYLGFLLALLILSCAYWVPIIRNYAISVNILPQQNVNIIDYSGRGITPAINDSSVPLVEKINILNKSDLKLTPGSMIQLEFEVTPPEAEGAYLFCDSENKQIVVVSDSGWVIARKEYQSEKPYEQVQITASALTGKSDEATVTVLYHLDELIS